MRSPKARIGDICEITTPVGLAYIQYTHPAISLGSLVRVLPGLFKERPSGFAELAKQRELYFVFYPLSYALRDRDAEVVSHQPVPEWAQPYPLMRWPGASDSRGRVVAWKIFKASEPLTPEFHARTSVIRTLTPEQEKLSIHHLWPHPVLVKELGRGWTPERAEVLRLNDVAEAAERVKNDADGGQPSERAVRYYFYFPKKLNAETAGDRLRDRGFKVVVRMGADGENWLALATKSPAAIKGAQMERLDEEMETLAKDLGGEYDGWEMPIDADLITEGTDAKLKIH